MLNLNMLVITVGFGMIQAGAVPGQGSLVGYCKTSEHCAGDECCVSFTKPGGGKRAAVFPFGSTDLMDIISGKCEKLVSKNNTCFIPGMSPSPPAPGLYFDCPCRAGLYCQGTGHMTPGHGEIGFCSENVQTRSIGDISCNYGLNC